MTQAGIDELWARARPMLASGPPDPLRVPHEPGWLYEVKWDGVRALARVDQDGSVLLRSRAGNDLGRRYPAVVAAPVGRALADVGPAILDGECVALDAAGRPSFPGALRGGAAVRFLCFDALAWRGRDVRDRPLQQRRDLVDAVDLAARTGGAWRTSEAFADGPALLAATAEQGLEGVMAKRLRSTYQVGTRSPDWVKLPHRATTSVVVVGWVRADGGDRLTSVLVADTSRRLVGAVGSGLSRRVAEPLEQVLRQLERPDPDARLAVGERAAWLRRYAGRERWVRPVLVADVRHLGRTESGALRQPVLVRLRPDLDVAELLGEPW